MLSTVKILVLNYSYEPLQFCDAKRAIIMIFNERAESIETNGYMVRSPNHTFELPAVIRILKMVKKTRRKSITFNRKNILRRDNYTCQYCGDIENTLTVDHVYPKSRGGESSWTNVVIACKPCNVKKGNQTPSEKGMHLFKQPFKPDFYWPYFHVPSGPSTHLEIWRKYLPASLIA